MTDADVASQPDHVPGMKHVAYQAVVLAQIQTAFVVAGHDPGGVLATVLQYRQGIIDGLVDRFTGNDPDNAAHAIYPCLPWCGEAPLYDDSRHTAAFI